MRTQREITRVFPVLLLEPNVENASRLAPLLEAAGFDVRIETRSLSAFQALRKSFFFALVVIADLTDHDCLVTLSTLRRKTPRVLDDCRCTSVRYPDVRSHPPAWWRCVCCCADICR